MKDEVLPVSSLYRTPKQHVCRLHFTGDYSLKMEDVYLTVKEDLPGVKEKIDSMVIEKVRITVLETMDEDADMI